MDKWEKLQQNLERFRGLEPNPVRRAFLDAPTLPGPTTTTIHNEFWFRKIPSLVEEFEKLSVITPATDKRDESIFELTMPKTRKKDSEEDAWNEPSLQQLFNEKIEVPDLIDFVSDNSVVAMIGDNIAKPFDPRILSSPSLPEKGRLATEISFAKIQFPSLKIITGGKIPSVVRRYQPVAELRRVNFRRYFLILSTEFNSAGELMVPATEISAVKSI